MNVSGQANEKPSWKTGVSSGQARLMSWLLDAREHAQAFDFDDSMSAHDATRKDPQIARGSMLHW
jgi:hypothetical protein